MAFAVLLTATVGLGIFAARVGIDNKVDVWFVDDDPALSSYRAFQEIFGNDEVVAIAIVVPEGIWRPEVLHRLDTLCQELEGLTVTVPETGAEVRPIARVVGLPTARLLETRADDSGAEDLETEGVLSASRAMNGPINPEEVERLRQRLVEDPLLKDRLVSADGTVATLFVQLATLDEIDKRRPLILQAMDSLIEQHIRSQNHGVHVAGIGVVYNALNTISQTEGQLFMVASFVLMFLLLWPLFRCWVAVGFTVLAATCALVMTRGLYGVFGHDDNMVTMTLPVVVLVLGVADCIHIFRFRAAHPDEPLSSVLARILRPCLFTTLTTMAGFAALTTSRMAVVRELGIYAATGIGLAFVSSLVCAAFCLGAQRDERGVQGRGWLRVRLRRPSPADDGVVTRLLRWSAQFSVKNRELVLGTTCVLILVVSYGISRLEVDTYSLGFLSPDHPVRADSEEMEKKIGPFTPVEFLVKATGSAPEPLKDPQVLRSIAAWQRAMEEDEQIAYTLSVADLVARLHQVQSPPGTALEVPDDPWMVAENLEWLSGDSEVPIESFADHPAWQTLRVTIFAPVLSAREYKALLERTMSLADTHVQGAVEVHASGYIPLYVQMMEYVVASQVMSFGLAFVLVFLLIGALFRSLRVTALSILPNVFPVFVTLGVMGFLDIRLDVATVTITSIILGIVVDDTIHYLHRFREELRAATEAGGDEAAFYTVACENTALSCGRSISATTLIFSAGFLVLGFASVLSIVYFGVLTALAMVVALVGDLLILPAVLVTIRPRV